MKISEDKDFRNTTLFFLDKFKNTNYQDDIQRKMESLHLVAFERGSFSLFGENSREDFYKFSSDFIK